jgi:AAA domain
MNGVARIDRGDLFLSVVPSGNGDVSKWRATIALGSEQFTGYFNPDDSRSRGNLIRGVAARFGADADDLAYLHVDLPARANHYLTTGEAGAPEPGEADKLRARTVRQLIDTYPRLRAPMLHGLLREGETMNIIAPPKQGKSWLVTDLALCVATGRQWLGLFDVEPGKVLIVDNELHGETSANRIPKVADARGIPAAEYVDLVLVANLRGRLAHIVTLGSLFEQFEPGDLRLIIIDAFYRSLPAGVDENDNGAIAGIYNQIDAYALRLGCCFVLIHHASKGNQSGKSVTDVGSGAGSQSRATDTHLILRPHQEPGAVVVDAAVRSWPPIEPRCLRWEFPVWTLAEDLDPADLKPDRLTRRKAPTVGPMPEQEQAPRWTAERFVKEFCGPEPEHKRAILARAVGAGLTENRATKLFGLATGAELLFDWPTGDRRIRQYATAKPPVETTRKSGDI